MADVEAVENSPWPMALSKEELKLAANAEEEAPVPVEEERESGIGLGPDPPSLLEPPEPPWFPEEPPKPSTMVMPVLGTSAIAIPSRFWPPVVTTGVTTFPT